MTNYYRCRNTKQTVIRPKVLFKLFLVSIAFVISYNSFSQIGLYMRDFEGTQCTYSGCTNDDDGRVPSCGDGTTNPCGTSICYLWLSNDMWVDTDTAENGGLGNGLPDGGTGSFEKSSNGSCPQLYTTATLERKHFIAVRVLFNSDFFPATPSASTAGDFKYHLKVSIVQASLGIVLNNFTEVNSTDITFKRTAANAVSTLGKSNPECKIAALASGIKDGFVVFLPWTPSGGIADHFCLLAELEKTEGPGGSFDAAASRTHPTTCMPEDPLTTHEGFWDYVQCNDNVIWRNIHIVNPPPPPPADEPAAASTAEMQINTPKDQEVLTTIEVQIPKTEKPLEKLWIPTLDWSALPKDLQPKLELMLQSNEYLRCAKWDGNYAKIPLEGESLIFPALHLPPDQKIPLKLAFAYNRAYDGDTSQYRQMVHVLQHEQQPGKERKLVGGNSILLISNVSEKKSVPVPDDCTGIMCWLQKYWLYLVIALGAIIAGWLKLRSKKK